MHDRGEAEHLQLLVGEAERLSDADAEVGHVLGVLPEGRVGRGGQLEEAVDLPGGLLVHGGVADALVRLRTVRAVENAGSVHGGP